MSAQLHFEDLSSASFEILTRELLARRERWATLSPVDAGPGGVHLVAAGRAPGDHRRWGIRCDDARKLRPQDARAAVERALAASPDLTGLVLVSAAKASASFRRAFSDAAEGRGALRRAEVLDQEDLTTLLYEPQSADLLLRLFGRDAHDDDDPERATLFVAVLDAQSAQRIHALGAATDCDDWSSLGRCVDALETVLPSRSGLDGRRALADALLALTQRAPGGLPTALGQRIAALAEAAAPPWLFRKSPWPRTTRQLLLTVAATAATLARDAATEPHHDVQLVFAGTTQLWRAAYCARVARDKLALGAIEQLFDTVAEAAAASGQSAWRPLIEHHRQWGREGDGRTPPYGDDLVRCLGRDDVRQGPFR